MKKLSLLREESVTRLDVEKDVCENGKVLAGVFL